MGELYRLDFPNGKAYIGITGLTAKKRFYKHMKDAETGVSVVSRAIAFHGARNVILTVLDRHDNWEILCNLERWAIAERG